MNKLDRRQLDEILDKLFYGVDPYISGVDDAIEAIQKEYHPLCDKQLAAARRVIAAFVYPGSAMTPEQREAWEAWQNFGENK